MTYPYLGCKTNNNDETIVVFFTSQNTGVVVMNETKSNDYKFGFNGNINEDEFDFLKEGICVRLNN